MPAGGGGRKLQDFFEFAWDDTSFLTTDSTDDTDAWVDCLGCRQPGRIVLRAVLGVAFWVRCDSLTGMKMRMMCVLACWLMCFGAGVAVQAEGLPDGVVEKLSSDKFEERSGAYAQLKKWSKSNLKTSPEQLHKVWAASKDPEVKTRCYALMKDAVIHRKFGRGKGFVGIMMDPVFIGAKPQQGKASIGINIVQVLPNTPAKKADLKPGDLILGIDALDFNNLPEVQQKLDVRTLFQEYVKSKHPDDVITLHLLRGGKKLDKAVTLMKRPASADRMFGQQPTNKKSESEAFFENWLKQAGGAN